MHSLNHIKQIVNLRPHPNKNTIIYHRSQLRPLSIIPHRTFTLPTLRITPTQPSAFRSAQMSGKLLFALYVVRHSSPHIKRKKWFTTYSTAREIATYAGSDAVHPYLCVVFYIGAKTTNDSLENNQTYNRQCIYTAFEKSTKLGASEIHARRSTSVMCVFAHSFPAAICGLIEKG